MARRKAGRRRRCPKKSTRRVLGALCIAAFVTALALRFAWPRAKGHALLQQRSLPTTMSALRKNRNGICGASEEPPPQIKTIEMLRSVVAEPGICSERCAALRAGRSGGRTDRTVVLFAAPPLLLLEDATVDAAEWLTLQPFCFAVLDVIVVDNDASFSVKQRRRRSEGFRFPVAATARSSKGSEALLLLALLGRLSRRAGTLPDRTIFVHGDRTSWHSNDLVDVLRHVRPFRFAYASLGAAFVPALAPSDYGELRQCWRPSELNLQPLLGAPPQSNFDVAYVCCSQLVVAKELVLQRPASAWAALLKRARATTKMTSASGVRVGGALSYVVKARCIETVLPLLLGQEHRSYPAPPSELCGAERDGGASACAAQQRGSTSRRGSSSTWWRQFDFHLGAEAAKVAAVRGLPPPNPGESAEYAALLRRASRKQRRWQRAQTHEPWYSAAHEHTRWDDLLRVEQTDADQRALAALEQHGALEVEAEAVEGQASSRFCIPARKLPPEFMLRARRFTPSWGAIRAASAGVVSSTTDLSARFEDEDESALLQTRITLHQNAVAGCVPSRVVDVDVERGRALSAGSPLFVYIDAMVKPLTLAVMRNYSVKWPVAPRQWSRNVACGDKMEDMRCLFQPLSVCEAVNADGSVPPPPALVAASEGPRHAVALSDPTQWRRVMNELSSAVHGSRARPAEWRHRGAFWWHAELLAYVARPSSLLTRHVERVRMRLAARWRENALALHGDDETGLVIGLHVRHGEVCSAAAASSTMRHRRCDDLGSYVEELHQLQKRYGIRRVFIATDSDRIVAQTALHSADFNFVYQRGVKRRSGDECVTHDNTLSTAAALSSQIMLTHFPSRNALLSHPSPSLPLSRSLSASFVGKPLAQRSACQGVRNADGFAGPRHVS